MTPRNKLAVIFDFDETLTDDSTSALLRHLAIDVDDFWNNKHKPLLDEGFDPTAAYLMLLVKELKARGELDVLKDENLRAFGRTLRFHPGVKSMFQQLRKLAGEVSIQFFVISGGLQEIIKGSGIAGELADFWGCTFHWDEDLGIPYPKNVVSFTEKTKYLFQINKGLIGDEYKNKPYVANLFMKTEERHIPLQRMMYIGDGLTDVPCFSILGPVGPSGKGVPIVVYNKDKERREGLQKAVREAVDLATEGRAHGPWHAIYRRKSELRNFIDQTVVNFVAKIAR